MSSETFLATFGLIGLRLVELHRIDPQRFAREIDAGRAYAFVPWQMALIARAMKLLPNAVFDRLFKRAGRKPRGLKL